MKKSLLLAIPFLLLSSLTSCKNNLKIENIGIIHEPEFGGVYIKKTIEEFNELGFSFGDSVNVKFSNGFEINDLPYYSGYYVDAGESLLVGYPGYDFIKVAINYGDDMFDIASLKETDTASIYLNKKAKYLDIQTALDIHYYDERERYTSDVEFANYRNISVGNIKENILYRSASPCDNKHNRASYVDSLMEQSNVQYILNLADTDEKIQAYIEQDDFNSPYFLSLYQNNGLLTNDKKVNPLAMNMNYTSAEFASKIAQGFTGMLSSDGPYLVHCLEGKDRTGFVCIVIEALLGASYQEIVDDYMLTYKNYYGIDINDPRYKTLKKRNVDSMLQFLTDDDTDITKANLVPHIESYLQWGGMTEANITAFKAKLSK